VFLALCLPISKLKTRIMLTYLKRDGCMSSVMSGLRAFLVPREDFVYPKRHSVPSSDVGGRGTQYISELYTLPLEPIFCGGILFFLHTMTKGGTSQSFPGLEYSPGRFEGNLFYIGARFNLSEFITYGTYLITRNLCNYLTSSWYTCPS